MNPKTRTRLLAVLAPAACVVTFAKCKDVLDTQPFGTLNTGTFYVTAKDFQAATIGAYVTFQGLTWSGRDQSLYRAGIYPDDDTRAPGSNEENDFSWTATNYNINYPGWEIPYRGILRANLILQQLDKTTQLTAAEKARFEGEAKFVRAYMYFQLARFYGTPPIYTHPATTVEEAKAGNSQPGEVWDLVESDLEDAIKGLAGQQMETGRATEWAARALLGKVELYRAQWGVKDPAILKGVSVQAKYQEAEAHLQAVVNSGKFSLVPYENNFKYTTENNPESLFELQASFGTDINGWAGADENGGGASSGDGRALAFGAGGGPSGTLAPGGYDWGSGNFAVTTSLVNEFERFDSATVTVPGSSQTTKAVIRDPRAYWTFYSPGEQYGHACGSAPAAFDFQWSCGATGTNIGAFSPWSVTGYTAAKYIRPFENYGGGMSLNQSVSQNNERLIRYADVLLLLAEAKLLGRGDVAGAAALINQVRARARAAYDRAYGAQSIDAALYTQVPAPANVLPDRPAGVSQQQMFKWLAHERRVELALEFNRYEDLVRWLRAGLITRADIDFGDNVANANFDPNKNLLRPIPLSEIDLNPNLKQNPGY